MTTIPSILDRLARWDCRLYRIPEGRNPLGMPGKGPWDISGTEYFLEDYIDFGSMESVEPSDFSIRNHDHVVAAVNNMQAVQFDLIHDALETRLDWRGYSRGDSGWAINVKLHDVWKYQRCWTVLDDLTEDFTNHDWQPLIDDEWDWFKTLVDQDYKSLESKKFGAGGNGGWLLYKKDEMPLDEAEQLYDLYQKVPRWVDGLCKHLATEHVAVALAELWDTDCEEVDIDNFTMQGINFKVDYDRDMK